tara:strand:+ start:866 stop:1735 length:870 start_codon:yes stop_codon:yes gene_type:complete
MGNDAEVFLKLELLQITGTFKPRGALTNMLNLSQQERERGVAAVSAGNHAIATAYAAGVVGTSAKVVMTETANPFRVELCRRYGAEVIFAKNVHAAFEEVNRISEEEGRQVIHPYEGKFTVMGQATLGLELCRQVSMLDAVIVPVGGGGLCAGVGRAVKLIQPQCKVFGVEPEGADTMRRSLSSGIPQAIDEVKTIADSLGVPYAAPYSFELCQSHMDDLVMINDEQMCEAMGLLFREAKLAVEPAGAAATAALVGPLRERLKGKRVGVIVCGTNIDPVSYSKFLLSAS